MTDPKRIAPPRTRREFLDEMFFAAAMAPIALAGLASPTRAEPISSRPQQKVRLAQIGVRSRGRDHLKGYAGLPDVEVVAICDIDQSMAERAAADVEKSSGKRPNIYTDLRKLLEDKDIDAVSMALPIHWHTLAALWAMQAGKDVYVEKPVSHNVREGQILAAAQARYGKICQCGTQSRSSRAVRDAIAHVHSGKIGKVSVARGLCYKRRESIGVKPDEPMAPSGVDYDLWLGPAPSRPFNANRFHYNWHWMWDYGTGDLGNQGIHQMDIARWALNKGGFPNSVQSIGGRFGYTDQGETPNTLASVFDYGDAALVFEVRGLETVGLSAKGAVPSVAIGDIVYGADGYVVFTANYGAAAAFDRDGNPTATFSGGGNHFKNFIDAVKARKQSDLNAPVQEGQLSSALCHLGNVSFKRGAPVGLGDALAGFEKSGANAAEAAGRMREHLSGKQIDLSTPARLGKALKIDPKTMRFVKDADADTLLTREYRKSFDVK